MEVSELSPHNSEMGLPFVATSQVSNYFNPNVSNYQMPLQMQIVPQQLVIPQRPRLEDYYTIGRKIGKGAFSTVYEGFDHSRTKKYAIKVINKDRIKIKLLQREIDIMTQVRHQHVLYCQQVFESDNDIKLVMEHVSGGELYDKIVEAGQYTEPEAKQIVLQILEAVEYLHKNGIAHRDLKCENILIESSMVLQNGFRREVIKVGDFGLAKMFSTEDLLTQCGSPTYVAPEVLNGKLPYNEAVDLWAIGVITFILLTGCFPFYEENNNYAELYKKIIAADYSFPNDIPLSNEAKNFIQSLLQLEPTKRLTPQKCREHPWLFNVPKI